MSKEDKIAKKIVGLKDDFSIISTLLNNIQTIEIIVTDEDISGKPIYAEIKFKTEKLQKPYFSNADIKACFEKGIVTFAKGSEWFVKKTSIMLENEYKKFLNGDTSNPDYQHSLNMSRAQAKKMIKLIYEQMNKATYVNSWTATNENGAVAYSDAYVLDCEWNANVGGELKTLKMPAYVKFQIDVDYHAMVIISFHQERKNVYKL